MAEPTTSITINLPSKYASAPPAPASSSAEPPLDWLMRTWTVTHSTLSMWRSARNVRITYKPLPAKPDGRARVDDLVEYEPSGSAGGALKHVAGVDTRAASSGGWDWRGRSWLFFVSSHWELLGWGEAPVPGEGGEGEGGTERWAVTWFAPTLFTKEGVDVYCDRREGLSAETYGRIEEALRAVGAKQLAEMVKRDMQPVEIKLPWTEK